MTLDTQTVTGIVVIVSAVGGVLTKIIIACGRAFSRIEQQTRKLEKIEVDSAKAVQQNDDLKKDARTAIEQNATIAAQTDGHLSALTTELQASRAETAATRAQNEIMQSTIAQLTTVIAGLKTPPPAVVVAPSAPREVRASDRQRNGDTEGNGK